MINKKLLLSALFTIALVYPQDSLITIGPMKYGKYNGKWHTIVNSEKGARVNTNVIIASMKSNEDINNVDFNALELPEFRGSHIYIGAGYYKFNIPSKVKPFAALQRFYNSGRFSSVFMSIFGELSTEPNDYYYINGESWNLDTIKMPQSWDITTGSESVIVAVIDVGTQYDHPDLFKNKWSGVGWDCLDNDSFPLPEYLDIFGNHHGTAAAGVIAASTNNDIGVSGIAGGWTDFQDGVQLMHLRNGEINNDPFTSDIDLAASIEAINYATIHGANVISCSWNFRKAFGPEKDGLDLAINEAVNEFDIVVVFSAGNNKFREDSDSIAWTTSRFH